MRKGSQIKQKSQWISLVGHLILFCLTFLAFFWIISDAVPNEPVAPAATRVIFTPENHPSGGDGAVAVGVLGTEKPLNYPKTANYYLGPTPRANKDITKLASYNLVILPVESQVSDRALLKELRHRNPKIILLAYVSSQSFNFDYWHDSLHQRLLAGIKDSWWLGDSSGKGVSSWPGTNTISVTSGWHDYFPQHLAKYVYSTGLWDGIFLDEFSLSISWLNNGDLDSHNDGIKDDPEILDAAWRHGSLRLLSQLRHQLGPQAIIITNGVSDPEVSLYTNGRMLEDFPTPWEENGSWSGSMQLYLTGQNFSHYPPINIINLTTRDTGERSPQRERFGLTSTLLGDGYLSLDYGISDHGQLWLVDGSTELKLGQPSGPPTNLLDPSNHTLVDSIWQRHFEHGLVLVNATNQPQTILLNHPLSQILGPTQPAQEQPTSSSWTIPAQDGLILGPAQFNSN